jgi:hypothetical protein
MALIDTEEAFMHGSFDKSGGTHHRVQRNWNIGFFALPVLLAITLIGLAIIQPAASNWISEAVQAEFAGSNLAPESAPTQVAQPATGIRNVNAN